MPAPLSKLREIFHRLVEAAPDDRARALDELCAGDNALRGEVQALLAEHDSGSAFLAEPTLRVDDGVAGDPLEWLSQRHIGPYHLLERIGEGGWGDVFMAEQSEPVRRKVALKILKPGMHSRQVIARFEAERQTLAMMDHPGIARVFDAGTTPQGRPYFVMELVDGIPVSDYCARHATPPDERLRLFTGICRAVQHAHSKGIIHRDLKPSNILICETDGRPVPKIIDFGIAKATQPDGAEHLTAVRQVIGTPAYMSPEQAVLSDQQLDTRSDIYSLGVVLYELLTGVTPFAARLRAAALAEMYRIIAEEPPPKPSTRAATLLRTAVPGGPAVAPPVPERLLRGDLDWIVMKALEKEPARRYETAAAFAEDIARHLAHEPVDAGPPSAFYRFRKFARRNRRTVAAAAIALAGLVAGLVLALREASARKVQALRAESLLRLQTQIFESAHPESARGEDYTVRELLNDFSVQFKQDSGVDPDVEISLRQTIGRAFQALARGKQNQTEKVAEHEKSDLQIAEDHFRAALALAEKIHGANSLEAAGCRHELGWVLRDQGRYLEARPELENALRIRESEAGANDPGTLTSRAFLARVLLHLNEPDKALNMARQAVNWPAAGPEAIRPLQVAAQVCMERGDLPAAATAAALSLDLARKADGGREAARCILPLQTLAAVRMKENSAEDAAALASRAAEIAGSIFGAEHRVTLSARAVLSDLKRAGETASDREGILESLRKTLGEEHPETFNNFVDLLGSVIRSNPDGARDFVFRMMGTSQEERDSGEAVPADGMNDFARRILARGNIGDYEAISVKALEFIRTGFGENHRNTIDAERALAFIYRQQKRPDEAVGIYRKSLAKCAEAFGATHALTCEARLLLAETHQDSGRYDLMEENLAGLRTLIQSREPHDSGRATQLNWLAALYTRDERWSEALDCLTAASATLRRLDARPEKLAAALSSEASVRRSLGQTSLAAALQREAFEICLAKLGDRHEQTWLRAARYVHAVQGGFRWRDAIPLLADFRTKAEACLDAGHSAIKQLRATQQRLTETETPRKQRAAQAEADYTQAITDSGAGSAATLEELRQLALMQGNLCDYPAVLRSLETYTKGIAALSGLTPPEKDDPAVLSAWFDNFFADKPNAEDERIIVSAIERISEEHAGMPAAERLLQRAATFFRDRGRSDEYFRLADALEDRRAKNVWPPENVRPLVPRGSIWTWSAPQTPPAPEWLSNPAFDDSTWRRGAGGFGGLLHLPRSEITRVAGADPRKPMLFRHRLTLPDKLPAKIKLRLRVVDGAVVWINGREVLRENVTGGPDIFTGSVKESSKSPRQTVLVLDTASVLRPGVNVIAAAAFTIAERTTLSQFIFDLTVDGSFEN